MMLLSWNDFINNSKNPTGDFEDLCRLFFKICYLKDSYFNLRQIVNNPGIETDPVLVDGERVGFQAKFFPKNVGYSQILHSAKETIKYYSSKIDKVIIFCNQDINDKAKDFVEAERILAEQNISIELCCNKSILDVISVGSEYGAIRNLFFGKLNLTDEWFNITLTRSLDELNPRYKSGFHVDEYDIQRHFDLLYRSDGVKKYILEIIDNAKKSLQQVTEYKPIAKSIKHIIDKFKVPEINDYEVILSWYGKFESIIQTILQEQEIVQKHLDECYASKEQKRNEEMNRLYYKQRQINELYNIVYEFNFSENEYFRFLNNNILIVEGDAGQGKSHLLGYEAESHSFNGESRTILLLGQKFILAQTPQEQILQILGLKTSFQEFVAACELKGSIDGKITVIMVDAINECYDQNIWKQYLNEIIEDIK